VALDDLLQLGLPLLQTLLLGQGQQSLGNLFVDLRTFVTGVRDVSVGARDVRACRIAAVVTGGALGLSI